MAGQRQPIELVLVKRMVDFIRKADRHFLVLVLFGFAWMSHDNHLLEITIPDASEW